VNFNMSDQDYINSSTLHEETVMVGGILFSQSMFQSLATYFADHAGLMSGENDTNHQFVSISPAPSIRAKPEGRDDCVVTERSLVLVKRTVFEDCYDNMNSVEFEWYSESVKFSLYGIPLSWDIDVFNFVLAGWDDTIRISTVRNLARFLKNLFRKTEFDYPYDAMVNLVSWGVLPLGVPFDVKKLENRRPIVGDRFYVYGKKKCVSMLSIRFVDKGSIVQTFIKYFSEFYFLRRGSKAIAHRSSPLFDSRALYYLFLQHDHF